jgi:hypothetical protein
MLLGRVGHLEATGFLHESEGAVRREATDDAQFGLA